MLGTVAYQSQATIHLDKAFSGDSKLFTQKSSPFYISALVSRIPNHSVSSLLIIRALVARPGTFLYWC
jgi:hypothetical protein